MKTSLILIVLLLGGCSIFGPSQSDKQITSAVTSYIEHQKTVAEDLTIPILEVYLQTCNKPLPPKGRDMIAYEIALRDAVVSYKECEERHNRLIKEVKQKQTGE